MDGLVSLVDLMEPADFEAGHVIVEENGEGIPSLYIATAGRLRISKLAPDGTPCDLAELSAPTIFGEIEFFCGIPPVCTAKAVSRLAAFRLNRQTFDDLFEAKHPALLQFTFNMARVACHRLAIADEMLADRLSGEDLVEMRKSVFSRVGASSHTSRTTGVFLISDLKKKR